LIKVDAFSPHKGQLLIGIWLLVQEVLFSSDNANDDKNAELFFVIFIAQ
jgi:hypothetical protein